MFSISTTPEERLLDDFHEHIERYHRVDDVKQAAQGIVGEATEL